MSLTTTDPRDEMEVEVFRAGDYGPKGRWGEEELEGLAADYDPHVHEAPVTLDHARQGPALGWVGALRRRGDRLVAHLRGVGPRLMALIRSGAFKKRSVELYPAFGETGRPYLRAVSFLGAAIPEVKGLADPLPESQPLFSDGDAETVRIENEDASQRERRTVAFEEMAGRLRETGRWRPTWTERGIRAFYEALDASTPIERDAERNVTPAQWFAEFLEDLTPLLALGETAANDEAAATLDETALPDGDLVDASSVAWHRAAVAFQETHPGATYAQALAQAAPRRRSVRFA